MKKLILVNIYPKDTLARYLLSSYVLKAYLDEYFNAEEKLFVEILNFKETKDAQKIYERVVEKKPDYVGYSCYIWNIETIIDVIKIFNENTKIIHILGGPEISFNKTKILKNVPADYFVIGEGEKILLKLMHYLKEKNKDYQLSIPDGVAAYIDGKLQYIPDTDKITDLDEIPSIYLNGVIEDKFYERQQAFLETQRGCRFKCKYCVYHKNLSGISTYSLDRVFKELRYLIIDKQILALRIFDSIFTSDLERSKKIIEYLIELKKIEGIRIPWIYWEFNYDMVDEEFIKLVSALKYRKKILNSNETKPINRPQHYSEMLQDYTAINCVGVQSFCKEALKSVNRARVNINKFEIFLSIIAENNVVLKIDLILGLPFETFDSYFDGLEFFLPFFKNTDHVLNIHRLQILPGSDLENHCGKYEIKYSLDAPHLVYSTNSLSESDLYYASKLSAILFRILNSPLRRLLFQVKEKSEKSFLKIFEEMLTLINNSKDFSDTKIVQEESVDDDYWNNEIYKEIPTEWIIETLNKY